MCDLCNGVDGHNIEKHKSAVFDALNIYLTFGRKKELWKHFENEHKKYIAAGGTRTQKYFIENLDIYRADGVMGK